MEDKEKKDNSEKAEKDVVETEIAKESSSENQEGTKPQEHTSESKQETKSSEEDDEISIDFSKIKNVFGKIKKSIGEDEKPDSKETKDDDEISIDFSKIKKVFKSEDGEEKEQSSKDDDDISIDFSKIKNVFKSDSKEENKKEKDSDNDEISIDFSKIKNVFKKESSSNEEDDDISVDFGKVKDFFIRNKVLFLLIIPLFLSIFLRIQTAYIPITDDWAVSSVTDGIRNQISSQISQQYPNLPDQNRGVLIENEFQKVLQQQKAQIDAQVTATSNAFKSRLQDDDGQTYLLAIDPYFWMRHARNILENGHLGDEIRDGRPYDNKMFAPVGRGVPFDMFHAYFIAFLYKFFSIFNSNLSLMKVAFYVPVLISALAVIPTFFITKKITGNFGGLIASIVVAIHPSFITRTVGGFSDTDAYNVMFPLFITWFFLEALKSKDVKKTLGFSVLSGLLVGLYGITWGGWWYIFDFILASTIAYIMYYSFVHKKELLQSFKGFLGQRAIKNSLIFIAIFFIITMFMISSLVSYRHFEKFYTNPAGFAKLKEVGINTIWPNVFTTVAEQNPASLNNVINQVGLGKFYFFLIALMGITLTLATSRRKKMWFILGSLTWFLIIFLMKVQNLNTFLILVTIPIVIRVLIALWDSDTEIEISYAIILILWFLATTFASTKGIRFTLLLVPVFAIGFGIALGELYKYLSSSVTRLLHVNKIISKTTIVVLLLLLLVGPYQSAANTVKNEIPSFNDAWKGSLEAIKADSQEDAIVNSWWDFGHWFKYWTDRGVTFDGTSQNTPPAHWIGKVLLTDNEETSIGILRMLDCSSRTGFMTVAEITQDGNDAIDLMNDIMPHDRAEAEKILEDKGFKKEESKQILDKTHCNPPEDYFITSEDMVGKSGVWSHFGSWDFDRALIYKTLKSEEYEDNLAKSVEFLKERFDYSKEDAESLYYEVQSVTNSDQANSWIAPWPGYAGSVECSRDENMLSCGNGFLVNLTSRDAWANSQQGLIRPKKISFPTEEGVFVREYDENVFKINNGRDLGLTLIKDGESYSMLQMDSDLVASMFTRLFYQEGHGLKYFKKFNDERSIFGGRIIVWKVDWEGKVIEDREKAEALQKALEEAQELDVIEEVVIESTDESIEIVEESKNESDILANNSDSSENTQ